MNTNKGGAQESELLGSNKQQRHLATYLLHLHSKCRIFSSSIFAIIVTFVLIRNIAVAKVLFQTQNIIEAKVSHDIGTMDPTSKTTFVFLVATEGSGHHMYSVLCEKSPSRDRINGELSKDIKSLTSLLYDHKDKSSALFSAPSSIENSNKLVNGTFVVEGIVSKLQSIEEMIKNASYPTTTTIPLNAVKAFKTGMMSYPNYGGIDKILQYPDLSTLYYACTLAGVSCRHVVLTRDPYDVIRSTTTRRKFFKSKIKAIQSYITMLGVILAQMTMYPDQLAACWEYNAEGSDNEQLGTIMGWSDHMHFKKSYASIFRESHVLNATERLELVPTELEVYMLSMEKTTETIQKTCKEILQSRG